MTSLVTMHRLPAGRIVRRTILLLLMLSPFAISADGGQGDADSPAEEARPDSEREAQSQPKAGTTDEPASTETGTELLGPKSREEWQEFLRWQEQQKSDFPASSVWSISLEGTADDERAKLKVAIKVHNSVDGPQRLALRLNQAVLEDTSYRGSGDASPGGFNRESGYRWWFTGKGQHELTLSLIVPVKNRRLQLSLPESTAVSSLALRLPLQQLKLQPLERSDVRIRPAGKDGSVIEVTGLGDELDLQWQALPNPKQVETVLQSYTEITAEFSDDSVQLRAIQQIKAVQGSFSDIVVQLPAGFEVLLLEVDGRQYADPLVDAGKPNRAVIRLDGPTTGPVKLEWTLESADPLDEGKLTLNGFAVEKSRRQRGEIDVFADERNRIVQLQDKAQLRRDGLARRRLTQPVKNGQMATAFRILNQPFQLELRFQEIEPYFTVKPQINLRLTGQRAEFDAEFEITVYRGAVKQIAIDWPMRVDEGWILEPREAPGLVEQVQIDRDSRDGAIRFQLLEPKTGKFKLPLKAWRPIIPSAEAFPFSLPAVHAGNALPTVLILSNADNIESDLAAAEMTKLRRVPIGVEFSKERRAEYRVETRQHRFRATVEVQQQTIRTETTLAVEFQARSLAVRQWLGYDVQYERLSEVRLMVPAKLASRVRFLAPSARAGSADKTDDFDYLKLSSTETGVEEDGWKQMRVTLPDARLDRFDVVAQFDLPWSGDLPPGGQAAVEIPILQTYESNFSSVRVELGHHGGLDAIVVGDGWEQQLSSSITDVWTNEKPQTQLQLQLTHTKNRAPQAYSVERGFIETEIGRDGTSNSRARYQIRGTSSSISVIFLQGLEPTEIWWNRQPLGSNRITQAEAGSYHLDVSGLGAEGVNLLTINFHAVQRPAIDRIGTPTLRAPHFTSEVWVKEIVWEVFLPRTQYLFRNPAGYTPLFHWQRATGYWSRQPDPQPHDLDAWISPDGHSPYSGRLWEGNPYRFSRLGPGNSLSLVTMSAPIIFLLGAGPILVGGIVLLLVPATRNGATFLTVLLALLVAAVWYAEPMKLLLQPAILGLLFPLAAASIQGFMRMKHGRSSAILTLSTASDFVGPSSSVDHAVAIGVGSEDVTAVGSPPMTPQTVPPSDDGSST